MPSCGEHAAVFNEARVRRDDLAQGLTLTKIVEAVIFAARENPNSHIAELQFASKLAKHPEIMGDRLGRIKYACRLLNVRPGTVLLDIGCGIGLNSVLSVLCGVREVHSVEMTSDRLRSGELIVHFLGLEDRIHIHGQDVLTLNLPARSIDAAFSFELLEHISDIGSLYGNLALWLKDEGRVFGRTGANGRSVINRRTFKKVWEAIDSEHYVSVRAEAIRSVAPLVTDADLKVLIDRTRGELIDDVKRAAEDYRESGTVPPQKPACAPRDPLTGQYMERLLDPHETVSTMDAQGFRTFLVKPDFSNITTVNPVLCSAFRAMGSMIRLTHPASLAFAPWLEFLSIRTPQHDPA